MSSGIPNTSAALLVRSGVVLLSLTPWAAVLFLHYVLEHGGIWDVSGRYRAAGSLLLIALGMLLSLWLHGKLRRRFARRLRPTPGP
jgi:hypothetical protein